MRCSEHFGYHGRCFPPPSPPHRPDLLLGRRTYDLWAGFWPTVKGGPFADRLNAAKKYVAPHRPDSLAWGPVGQLGIMECWPRQGTGRP